MHLATIGFYFFLIELSVSQCDRVIVAYYFNDAQQELVKFGWSSYVYQSLQFV